MSIFFKLVPKNPKKSRKNLIFSLFFLWSHPHFCKKLRYHLSFKTRKKSCKKKVEKKVVFVFTNFFFKIDFGHFFMSNFKIKKKVLNFLFFLLFWPFLLLIIYHLSSIFQYLGFCCAIFAFSLEHLVLYFWWNGTRCGGITL